MTEKTIVLFTSMPQTLVEVAQARLDNVLKGKKIEYEKIDGVAEENKPIRDQLFRISNERGKYPQIFLRKEDGTYKFVGLWETVSLYDTLNIINIYFNIFFIYISILSIYRNILC